MTELDVGPRTAQQEPLRRPPEAARGADPDSRRRLLESGVDVLLELTPADVLSAVGVREIARRGGVSVTTLYKQFGSLEGFADALVQHVFDPDRPHVRVSEEGARALSGTSLPMDTAVAYHQSELERLTTDREFRVRMGLWALGGRQVDEAYRAFLRRTDERIASGARALLEAWGRELRPPFDLPSYVAAHVSLVTGFTVREMVDPGTVGRQRFARAAASLSYALLRLKGDQHSLDDRLAEINFFPLHDRQGHGAGPGPDGPRSATRARILDAAAALLGRGTFERTTIAQVAKEANVSTSTVYDYVDNMGDLACRLFVEQARDVLAERPTATPEEAVRTVAAFTATRLEHAAPYLGRLVAGRVGDDPLVETMRAALETRAMLGEQREGWAGEGSVITDLDELAFGLVATVVSRSLRYPADREGAVAAGLRLLPPA